MNWNSPMAWECRASYVTRDLLIGLCRVVFWEFFHHTWGEIRTLYLGCSCSRVVSSHISCLLARATWVTFLCLRCAKHSPVYGLCRCYHLCLDPCPYKEHGFLGHCVSAGCPPLGLHTLDHSVLCVSSGQFLDLCVSDCKSSVWSVLFSAGRAHTCLFSSVCPDSATQAGGCFRAWALEATTWVQIPAPPPAAHCVTLGP